jgi:hypothetical protein
MRLPTVLKAVAVAGSMLSVRSYVETRSCISVHRNFAKIASALFCRLADGRTLFPALVAHLTQ